MGDWLLLLCMITTHSVNNINESIVAQNTNEKLCSTNESRRCGTMISSITYYCILQFTYRTFHRFSCYVPFRLTSPYCIKYQNIMGVECHIYIIVTDMEGNIRTYRLPKGRGPYHDPRAIGLSWYCTLYQ